MDIATLWIKRKGCEDGPAELIAAWDEYSIEMNFEGWQAACDRELKAVGDDVAAKRFVNLRVNGDLIEEAFREWQLAEVERVQQLDDPRSL